MSVDWTIENYQDARGHRPVEEFIRTPRQELVIAERRMAEFLEREGGEVNDV